MDVIPSVVTLTDPPIGAMTLGQDTVITFLTRVNKIRSQMEVVDLTKLFYAVIQTGWRIFYKPSSVQQTFRTNKQLKVVNSYYLLQRPKNTREVKEKA